MVDVASESPARFGEGQRQRPSPPASSPENESSSQPEQTAGELPDLEPRGWRAKVDRLRSLGNGEKRPLGSPEGPGHTASPPPSRSPGSSNERRVVDACAVGVRQLSSWVDWFMSRRFPDKDFIATSEECYAIASPLAGDILDRIPESGPLAEMAEHAGAVGAGLCTVSWLVRAGTGRPGGRVESEELQERVVRRLGGAKRRVREEVAEEFGGANDEPPAAARSYSSMLGDDDFGTDASGPI